MIEKVHHCLSAYPALKPFVQELEPNKDLMEWWKGNLERRQPGLCSACSIVPSVVFVSSHFYTVLTWYPFLCCGEGAAKLQS